MTEATAGRWDSSYHAPVLVEEVGALFVGAREVLDCTLGGGGHSEALLAAGSSVVAVDRDEAAIDEARKRLACRDDLACLIYTSGTGGAPRNVPLGTSKLS